METQTIENFQEHLAHFQKLTKVLNTTKCQEQKALIWSTMEKQFPGHRALLPLWFPDGFKGALK